jgi:hypothetical protein
MMKAIKTILWMAYLSTAFTLGYLVAVVVYKIAL